jgi:hypothetical protein
VDQMPIERYMRNRPKTLPPTASVGQASSSPTSQDAQPLLSADSHLRQRIARLNTMKSFPATANPVKREEPARPNFWEQLGIIAAQRSQRNSSTEISRLPLRDNLPADEHTHGSPAASSPRRGLPLSHRQSVPCLPRMGSLLPTRAHTLCERPRQHPYPRVSKELSRRDSTLPGRQLSEGPQLPLKTPQIPSKPLAYRQSLPILNGRASGPSFSLASMENSSVPQIGRADSFKSRNDNQPARWSWQNPDWSSVSCCHISPSPSQDDLSQKRWSLPLRTTFPDPPVQRPWANTLPISTSIKETARVRFIAALTTELAAEPANRLILSLGDPIAPLLDSNPCWTALCAVLRSKGLLIVNNQLLWARVRDHLKEPAALFGQSSLLDGLVRRGCRDSWAQCKLCSEGLPDNARSTWPADGVDLDQSPPGLAWP